ncbi:transcription factor DUO1-like [Cynara cardunculus var. scolymus]|uniref:transcription factor DUO1-like n=1 Tax=Cynara cardunculus var. scolymus TaxID=59895 RepID=UPI000D629F7F|nr:transcription factor DUO1-like [Cynara cardunculus var. scolymus]
MEQRIPIKIKKGPWKIEEDELLIKHVEEYGPKDWDLPLSKGHLQRTGKSCRLRWLNNYQPNLKKGMFSEMEKQMLFDLQGKYGNKWAKIATHLPGRSVYHVKNVWWMKLSTDVLMIKVIPVMMVFKFVGVLS